MSGITDRAGRGASKAQLRRIENSFKAPADEMLGTSPAMGGRAVLMGCTALVMTALTWSCVGRLDIVATAHGRIVSQAETKTIQPVETGIVRAIHVGEGQHVRAGEVLAELDATQANADLVKAHRQALQDQLDIARLQGLLASADGTRTPALTSPPEAPLSMIEATRTRMLQQDAEQAAKLASLDQQIAEKAGEIRETAAQIVQGHDVLPLLSAEQGIRDASVALGVGNKIDQLEIHQRVVTQREGLNTLQAHQLENIANLRSLVAQRAAAFRTYEDQSWTDLEKAQLDLIQAEDDGKKATDRQRSERLVSPVSGTVQQLVLTTLGGVVTPGQSLMAIVPDDEHLAADVMLDNRDIGFVHPGQEAEVKVNAFSYTRYGMIKGQVQRVSLDAAVTNHAMPYSTGDHPSGGEEDAGDTEAASKPPQDGYIARVLLSRSWVKTELGVGHLEPGMEVTADVKTGSRRIIAYLLGPAFHTIHDGLRER